MVPAEVLMAIHALVHSLGAAAALSVSVVVVQATVAQVASRSSAIVTVLERLPRQALPTVLDLRASARK
ncbi:hypothetical protein K461DRAFT_273627 [Myriangium duriaei CBS 260.36]|uniref:Uncharacterized protein n=1 Tax=Myriangium duriaei CBS 260.36 TaxID=1168546 RepID=A0A9P4J8S9_9PEZI|nr:hypothetical protein K461DRAFT_273627 [Myriangium duriaei CBS 260.36]